MITQRRRSLPAADRYVPPVDGLSWWVPAVISALGLCVALLVATDGSWGWRVIWVAFVIGATIAAINVWAATGRAGGWVSLSAGSIGLVIGISFGLRYLAVAGIGWRAAVGIVALLAGVTLLAAGIRRVVTGHGRLGGAVMSLGMVLAVAVVVWTATPAVLATNVPPIAHGRALPSDYGMTARTVDFAAADGTPLWAWYVPSRNGAAVVLRHGGGSDASRVLSQAAVLAGHGYGVLVTDARGHGLSGGRAMDFGWYGDMDVTAAVDYLAGLREVDAARIGVIGLSMGGEEAIGAAAADPRIKAIVAEGATARSEADKTWFTDVYGLRGRIQLGLEWAQYTLTDLLTDAARPTPLADAVEAAGRPLLLITAGGVPDEANAAEYLRDRAPARVSVWTVPGAGHIQGLSTDPSGWESRVIGFLDANLGR